MDYKIYRKGRKHMLISSKGQYALRMMMDLVIHYGGNAVTVKAIANRQQMSEKYLEQVTATLSRAGYLKSTRGAKGGYRLANKPEEYTVGMILRTIEGSLAPVDVPEEESEGVLQLVDCVINEVWDQLGEAIDDVVDHITLADLIKNYNERIGYVYSI